jgi:hypothetical protein
MMNNRILYMNDIETSSYISYIFGISFSLFIVINLLVTCWLIITLGLYLAQKISLFFDYLGNKFFRLEHIRFKLYLSERKIKFYTKEYKRIISKISNRKKVKKILNLIWKKLKFIIMLLIFAIILYLIYSFNIIFLILILINFYYITIKIKNKKNKLIHKRNEMYSWCKKKIHWLYTWYISIMKYLNKYILSQYHSAKLGYYYSKRNSNENYIKLVRKSLKKINNLNIEKSNIKLDLEYYPELGNYSKYKKLKNCLYKWKVLFINNCINKFCLILIILYRSKHLSIDLAKYFFNDFSALSIVETIFLITILIKLFLLIREFLTLIFIYKDIFYSNLNQYKCLPEFTLVQKRFFTLGIYIYILLIQLKIVITIIIYYYFVCHLDIALYLNFKNDLFFKILNKMFELLIINLGFEKTNIYWKWLYSMFVFIKNNIIKIIIQEV